MRKQFIQLIGLALIGDDELKEAWIREDVFEVLLTHGQETLFAMEVGEEVELIVAAREMLEEQLRPRKGALEQLRTLRDLWTGTPATTESKNGTEPDRETDDSPTSSTPSPEPTDGTPDESSSPATEPSPTT
jgi:hypothetical protein